MARTFSSIAELQSSIESACSIAVENTCTRLLDRLRELIQSEYYSKYNPVRYKRTFQFYESATTKMVNKLCGSVFMDSNTMKYNNYWDGVTQLYMANAGYHGTTNIYRPGFYFKEFISYCNDNAMDILKEEMKKQGLNIK